MRISWILRICDKFVYLFCLNTDTKLCEPYHSNYVIPHRGNTVKHLYLAVTEYWQYWQLRQRVLKYQCPVVQN